MKKLAIMNNFTRTFNKVVLSTKKHSPEILIVAGVVGAVTSAVMACKATTKASKVIEQAKKDIDDIHDVANNPEKYEVAYSEEDTKQDLTIVYAKTAVELVKLYAPSVALGALSLTAMISSNQILRKRNIALAGAYKAVDKAFKDYRGRVVERFGKELDQELRYNIKAKQIEEKIVNEDGTESTVTKTVNVVDDNSVLGSQYSFFFDETSANWSKDPEYNKMFLMKQQSYFNDRLKRKGHLFLNEVLDGLGIDRTRAGAVVGWRYDENDPDCDCFVDFGIMNVHREASRRFVNGYEKSVMLDFNVDGVIYDKI